MSLKISVIIPTFRRPVLLKKCLDSMTRQTFSSEDFEVIVVSDGPDSITESAVNDFIRNGAGNFRFLSLREKKGPAAARNTGWKNAEGQLIAFTDDDCIADSAWLENLWKRVPGTNQLVACSGRIIVPLQAGPTDYQLNTRRLEDSEFVTANCACTKSALLVTGGFDEQFGMAWREDSDLHFRFLEFSIPVIPVKDAVILHPARETSWGASLREQKKSMYNALLYKKYPRLYRQKIQKHAPWHYYLIVVSFSLAATGFLINEKNLMLPSLVCWLTLTVLFMLRRIAPAKKSPGHIFEMILTSLFIPFLSVFWRCYGGIKFRTVFM